MYFLMSKLYDWQAADYNYLTSLISRLPTAILLHGAKGLGKLNLAYNFIAKVFCEFSNSSEFPCGTCQSCNLLIANSHPDLYVLRPNEDSDRKVKQINVG